MTAEEVRQAIREALELWNQGNRDQAIETIRPAADQKVGAGLALISWFLQQMGEPRWREGIPYAEAAAAAGNPFPLTYFWGQMLNDPGLRSRVVEYIRPAVEAGWMLDPVGNAMQPFQAGDPDTAIQLVELSGVPRPYPHAWSEFIANATRELEEITSAAGVVTDRRDAAVKAIAAHEEAIAESRTSVETETKQLETLIEQLTNAEAQTFFDSEATKNEEEGRVLWRLGIGTLIAAALLAIAPIAIYYIGRATNHDWFADQNLVAAHFAPAVAFGAVAGVLLARARGRDRARQKARDLSVALGTMFVYSNQIADLEARQSFISGMGRTIIEAFLRQDSAAPEGGPGMMDALRRA